MFVQEMAGPARVLLVDDESTQLELRRHVLKMYGFSVLTACGPVEALTAISAAISADSEKFDVAVLDYHMPGMNGSALADCIRSRHPALKIILHSGGIDIPGREMTSVDVFVAKGDGIEPLIAHIVGLTTGAIRLPAPSARAYELAYTKV